MRVVFVDNLLFENAEGIRRYVLQPHLGLISLIAVIEGGGHEGHLFDPKVEVTRGALHLDENLYRDMARRILRLQPDAVGLTSLGCNFICTVKTAAYLKEAEPDLPILLGGPHASVLDRRILEAFPQFDLIVRNEAEETILSVLEALPKRTFIHVPGVSYRAAGVIHSNQGEPSIADLDTLPLPAYHRFPVRELGLTSLRVDAGRGCPFQCTFCSTASFFGRKYRLKSAKRLREELDLLHASYGITDFALTHDLFTVNRRKVLEFCDAIEECGYTWKCSARQDCVDEELLRRMYAAGCRSIYYGIETGSVRMQRISKKRLDLSLFDRTIAFTQDLGMSATVSFISGYPEEEKSDQDDTLDLIGRCFEKDDAPLNVQLHLLTPEPGTELLNQYEQSISYDGHVSDFNFPSLEADDGTITEKNPRIFINHHYFPSVLSRDRHVFVTTSYQFLYGLGFPLLRYILRRFDGRFSNLIDSIDAWRLRGARSAVCDQSAILAYFGETFGKSHHIAGLAKYMLSATELRRRAINGLLAPTAEAEAGDCNYVLSKRALILRGVPDCQRIMSLLVHDREAKPRPNLLRRRHDLLLRLSGSGMNAIENFQLSPASVVLLEYLSEPRDRLDKGAFERDTGYPLPPVEFMRLLAARGVLESKGNASLGA